MTREIGPNTILIEREPDSTCAFCGKVAECRPYGPGGKSICHDCAVLPKYEHIVKETFMKRLKGVDLDREVIVIDYRGQRIT